MANVDIHGYDWENKEFIDKLYVYGDAEKKALVKKLVDEGVI